MKAPSYRPDFLHQPDRYNTLCLFDVHTNQKNGKNYSIGHNLGEDANDFAEAYSIDDVVIGGDFGSRDAVTGFLEAVEDDITVQLIEGDGDREKKRISGKEVVGWSYYTDPEAREPFPNTGADYRIQGRTYERQFENYDVWFQHEHRDTEHPEEPLFNVEPDLRGMDYNIGDIPQEFLGRPAIGIHGHLHRPRCSEIGSGALFSLGGFMNNYDVTALLPDRSYHILSFGNERVDNIHFDAERDEVFEHHSFSLEDGHFRKNFEYGEEEDLSIVHRFLEIPDKVRETERFRPSAAD